MSPNLSAFGSSGAGFLPVELRLSSSKGEKPSHPSWVLLRACSLARLTLAASQAAVMAPYAGKQRRAYIVCRTCPGWIFQDRVQSIPTCRDCGTAWGTSTGAGSAVKVGRQAHENGIHTGRRARSRGRKVRWSDDEWEAFQASQVSAPPGLSKQSAKAKPPASPDAEAVQALYAGADDTTKALLERAGIRAPEPVQMGLEELCRRNMPLMPESIQAILADEGPQQTPAQAATAAGKALKEAASSLRTAVGTKVALQSKLDKAKQACQALLDDMSTVNLQIETKEKEVLDCQKTLKDSAASVPEPSPLPDVVGLIRGIGIDLTEEQKIRLQAAVGEASRGHSENPPDPPLGLRMPFNPQADASQLPAEASADLIRTLREDLTSTQAELVRTMQALQKATAAKQDEEVLNRIPQDDAPMNTLKAAAPSDSAAGEVPSKKSKAGTEGDRSRSPKSKQPVEG